MHYSKSFYCDTSLCYSSFTHYITSGIEGLFIRCLSNLQRYKQLGILIHFNEKENPTCKGLWQEKVGYTVLFGDMS